MKRLIEKPAFLCYKSGINMPNPKENPIPKIPETIPLPETFPKPKTRPDPFIIPKREPAIKPAKD